MTPPPSSSDIPDSSDPDWHWIRVTIDDNNPEDLTIQQALEPMWWTIDFYEGEELYTKTKSQFTRPQVLMFAVEWYIAEVGNGGHDQFYANSTGLIWKDALEGLRELNFPEAVEILTASASRLGGTPADDRDERSDQMEQNPLGFEDLDDQFSGIVYDAIEEKMQRYINDNRKMFYFDGLIRAPKDNK